MPSIKTKPLPTSPYQGRSNNFPLTRGIKGVCGFTLVELIVVITILVILGTITFINLGNFSNSVRDSARISDTTNITQGLELLLIRNGTVPPPEAGDKGLLTISFGATILGYQGYVGPNILSQIRMSDARDPTDKRYYTYLTNATYSKYQILTLLEDPSTNITMIDTAFAGYETRIPLTKGTPLGVLLDGTGSDINTPIQEYISSPTTIDITTYTGSLGITAIGDIKAIFTKDAIATGTGNIIAPPIQIAMRLKGTNLPPYIQSNTYSSNQTFAYVTSGESTVTVSVTSQGVGVSNTKADQNCDTPDIAIWRIGYGPQIWAACNVGATTSAEYNTVPTQLPSSPTTDGLVPTNRVASVQGNYYQWGRNDNVTTGTWAGANVTYGGALTSPANTTGNTTFYGGDVTYKDWHWAGATNPIGGWNVANGGNNQGPCATGYHVPTTDITIPTTDWKTAALLIVGTASPATTHFDTIRSILKLPLAGYRSWTDGQYYYQGINGLYWSSSPYSTSSHDVNFSSGNGGIAGIDRRGYGFPVRCIKN